MSEVERFKYLENYREGWVFRESMKSINLWNKILSMDGLNGEES